MLEKFRDTFHRLLAGWRPPDPEPPADPYAGVRHPRMRDPGGRSSAIAVTEPDPDQDVQALGRSLNRNTQ